MIFNSLIYKFPAMFRYEHLINFNICSKFHLRSEYFNNILNFDYTLK